MGSALSQVISGALFNETRIATLANNIANTGTVGFKGDRVAFVLPAEESGAGDAAPAAGTGNPQELYLGNPVQTYTDFSSGHVVQTGNPLDLALEGSGFFNILTPGGTQYTRSGNFTLNADGTLVTADGFPVLGDGGEITVGGGRVEVDAMGNVRADGAVVGRLRLTDFPQQTALVKVGMNRFGTADPAVTGLDAENVQVRQGAVEQSNVDVVRSMTEMIEALRGFESYQKMIQFLNDANERVINDVGRAL